MVFMLIKKVGLIIEPNNLIMSLMKGTVCFDTVSLLAVD
ncbi:hypothetical protein VIRA109638_11650 [Vibrio rarus]